MAKIYLALQATSAPSERVFSQASLLLSAKRTRMDPDMAGKTLFVKQNWDKFKNDVNYLAVIATTELELLDLED